MCKTKVSHAGCQGQRLHIIPSASGVILVTGTDAGAGLSGGAVGRVAAVAVVEFVGAWAVTAAEGLV